MVEIYNSKKVIIFTVLIFFITFFLVFYYIFYWNSELYIQKISDNIATISPMLIINTDKKYVAADQLYKQGKPQEAYTEFSKIVNEDVQSEKENDSLLQTLKLYKTASLREFDREASFKEYYDFYRDTDNSLLNRAYALLMAQQEATAGGDIKKLLFVLSEQEVKDIKILDDTHIGNAISKKIYELYPFPITAARLAIFEIGQLEPSKPGSKEQAKAIYQKYMFNFDQNIQLMLTEDGLKHLVANSVLNKSILMGKMEDYRLISSASTTASFSEAIKYAVIYSPRGTYHFILLRFLDNQIKINNQDNIDKIIDIFKEEKAKYGIYKSVSVVFGDTLRLQKEYPNLSGKMNNSKEFNRLIALLFKS